MSIMPPRVPRFKDSKQRRIPESGIPDLMSPLAGVAQAGVEEAITPETVRKTPLIQAFRDEAVRQAAGVGTPQRRARMAFPPDAEIRPQLEEPIEHPQLPVQAIPENFTRPRRVEAPLPPLDPSQMTLRERAQARIGLQKKRDIGQVLKDIGVGLAGGGLAGALLGGIKGGDYRYLGQLQAEMADLEGMDRRAAEQQAAYYKYLADMDDNAGRREAAEMEQRLRQHQFLDTIKELLAATPASGSGGSGIRGAGTAAMKARVYNPEHQRGASAMREGYELSPLDNLYRKKGVAILDPKNIPPGYTEAELAAKIRAEADQKFPPWLEIDLRNLRDGMEVDQDYFTPDNRYVYSKARKQWLPVEEMLQTPEGVVQVQPQPSVQPQPLPAPQPTAQQPTAQGQASAPAEPAPEEPVAEPDVIRPAQGDPNDPAIQAYERGMQQILQVARDTEEAQAMAAQLIHAFYKDTGRLPPGISALPPLPAPTPQLKKK